MNNNSKIDHQLAYRTALQYLLKQKGWGAETAIAVEADIDQGYLNKIKFGEKRGAIDTLHAIAEALETTYSKMLELGERLIKQGWLEKPINYKPEEPGTREVHAPGDVHVFGQRLVDQREAQPVLTKINQIFREGDAEDKKLLIAGVNTAHEMMLLRQGIVAEKAVKKT